MTTHTPGPWTHRPREIAGHRDGYLVENPRDEMEIAQCIAHHVPSLTYDAAVAVTEANARLIAAAPQMLDFIRKAAMLPTGDEWPYEPALVTAARALLARIEGNGDAKEALK